MNTSVKILNVECSKTRVFSTNFYHFLVQQMQAIYFYSVEHSLQKINLYYEGPFESIIKDIPFINLFKLNEAPSDTLVIEPYKDYKLVKTYAHYLNFVFSSKYLYKQN